MGSMIDFEHIIVENAGLSPYSAKTERRQVEDKAASSSADTGKKRNFFKRDKREEKEQVPEWKLEQEKKFKDWNKSMDKQRSTVGFFTDFYKPREGKNKGFWVWWIEAIAHFFALSQEVFSEFERGNPPSSYLSTWETYIRHQDAMVAYTTLDPEPNPSKALGLFFSLPRTQSDIGYELPHLWIAAIKSEYRGLGMFPVLMDRVKQYARECGHKEMTVCTYPEQCVKMYRLLCQDGWEEISRTADGKALMKHAL
ncbi:hypothetical protein PRZ48_000213 [Zasmidium cellare]|uniref:N-acetyltransferase domain-containing protein n=1 Tax=Zasmidium cellare TaxID=395010 RepID=A0ABR0EZF6_ZASCE|nr:hypothetical protein PRZ48_000213 [Zasmidium cellare]